MRDPVYSPNRLAFELGFSRAVLEGIGTDVRPYYKPFDKRRRGRKPRHIDNPVDPLKAIQSAIYRRLLKPIEFPLVLQGAVPGGSPERNAILHIHQRFVVTLDIQRCFPSITNRHVFSVWRYTLGHSPTVARLLTQLTTFLGHLPQGAPTSSALANLVILPAVREVEAATSKRRLRLGQFVDDQAISGSALDHEIVTLACRAFSRIGLPIGRSKLRVMRSGSAQIVTGFTVNSRLGIPKRDRARIRAAVHDLEHADPHSPALATMYLSAVGRTRRLARFHPGKANRLRERVDAVVS